MNYVPTRAIFLITIPFLRIGNVPAYLQSEETEYRYSCNIKALSVNSGE